MFKNNYHAVRQARGGGFTLTELLVALAIGAILLGLAAPSFNEVIARYRVTEVSRGMADRLQVAMNNSETRGRTSICVSSNGTTCATGSAWAGGYMVFSDGGVAGVIDGTDRVLERAMPARAGLTIVSTAEIGGAPFTTGLITFDERAPDIAHAIRFTVCKAGREPHLIVLNRIGSVRQSKGTTLCV